MKKILKVMSQSEVIDVQKRDGGTIKKSTLVLTDIGSEYEDKFAVTLLGNLAGCKFYQGELVYAALFFTTHEHNGNVFQEVAARDVIKINK